jgi:hypothetical protein
MPRNQDICEKPGWRFREERRSGDYAYAQVRAVRPKSGRHLVRGYEVATHFVKVIAARHRRERNDLDRLFNEHAERWRNETGHLSSVTKMIAHPSYLRIIGFGPDAIPLLLEELKARPDHWLVALNAITGKDPAPEGATFKEAVTAWIKWGESEGYY